MSYPTATAYTSKASSTVAVVGGSLPGFSSFLQALPVQGTAGAAVVTTAIAGILSSSPMSSMDTLQFASLLMASCGNDGKSASLYRFVISVWYDLGPTATVAGNLGIVAAVLLIHYALTTSWLLPCHKLRVKVTSRFPNIPIKVSLLMIGGVVFGSVTSLSGGNSSLVESVAIGVLGTIAVVGLLGLQWFLVEKVVVRQAPVLQDANRGDFGLIVRLTMPSHVWTPKSLRQQYGALFSTCRSASLFHFQCLNVIHSLVVVTISAAPFPRALCSVQYGLLASVGVLPILLVVWKRPFRAPLLAPLSVAIAGCLVLIECLLASESGALGTIEAITILMNVLGILRSVYAVSIIVFEKHANNIPQLSSTDARLGLRPCSTTQQHH